MTTRAEFERLLTRFSDVIRHAFEDAIADISDNVVFGELARRIEDGDIRGALRSLGIGQATMNRLSVAIENAYAAGGTFAGAGFPILNTSNGRAVFRFDVRNIRAEQYLRATAANNIERLTTETRANIRTLIETGVRDGRGPASTALDLVGRIDRRTGKRVGGVIGLTPGQKGWVDSTRADLQALDKRYFTRDLRDKRFDGIVHRAIKEGKPLDAETVQRLTTRYEANALRYRGEAIGRTEALAALNHADREAYKQAVDSGAAREQDIQRFWRTGGANIRDTHSELDVSGKSVGLNEPFVSSSGARLMQPGDTSLGAPAEEIIHCKCHVVTRVDWLAASVEP